MPLLNRYIINLTKGKRRIMEKVRVTELKDWMRSNGVFRVSGQFQPNNPSGFVLDITELLICNDITEHFGNYEYVYIVRGLKHQHVEY